MTKFVFREDTVVTKDCGAHTARCLAGIEYELPEVLHEAAIKAGGTVAEAPKKRRTKAAPAED